MNTLPQVKKPTTFKAKIGKEELTFRKMTIGDNNAVGEISAKTLNGEASLNDMYLEGCAFFMYGYKGSTKTKVKYLQSIESSKGAEAVMDQLIAVLHQVGWKVKKLTKEDYKAFLAAKVEDMQEKATSEAPSAASSKEPAGA